MYCEVCEIGLIIFQHNRYEQYISYWLSITAIKQSYVILL